MSIAQQRRRQAAMERRARRQQAHDTDRPEQRARLALRQPGLRLPRHRATTAQLGAIFPFQAHGGLGGRGIYLGVDVGAGGAGFCFDPFEAYAAKIITAPNMLVIGQLGQGKSSLVKCFLYRSVGVLAPGGRRRFVAILDPKGEYGPLAAALDLACVKLTPGGADRLNPLAAAPGITDPLDQARRRTTVVVGLAEAALDRNLSAFEDAAVGWATQVISERAASGRDPEMGDVVALLAAPTAALTDRAGMTEAEFVRAIADVRFGLSKLLDRQLGGMLNGQSTVPLDRQRRGLVIDLSSVFQDHDALNVVMIAVTGWLQALLANPAARAERLQAFQVWDECWALTNRLQSAKYMQACQKLARSYGVCNVAITHRISDLRAQHDDGTAAQKISEGLLADSQIRVLFRQPTDQIPDARRLLGLTSEEAAQLAVLPKARALWKIAEHTTQVDHCPGAGEWGFCDTDEGMAVEP